MRLIDADVTLKHIDEYYDLLKRMGKPSRGMTAVKQNIKTIVNSLPTIDAIPISFIEEQVKLCNEIGFRRGEECYMALIEKWREKNDTETD